MMNDDTIRSAIENNQVLSFDYDGYDRVASPHTYGINKDGDMSVLVYQTEGHSSTNTLGWKCMKVAEISNLRVETEKKWETDDNHSQPQTCIKDVLAEVSY